VPYEETARLQRTLTVEFITRRRLTLPAIWFRPNTGDPNASDILADKLEVDLGAWDGPERNLGVRLEAGHLELGVKAGDDAFMHAFFLAAEHLRIDARCAFGVHQVSSILINVEDQELIEPWAARWPKGFKDKHGHWTETAVRTSSLATKSAKAVYRFSKPLPGSITPEGPVVWRPKGKPAAQDFDIGIEDLEPRALAPTGMDSLIRALAYATLVYWIRVYLDGLTDWDSILTRTLGGWLARVEVEGRAINAQGKSLEGICWCPIDTREQALDLIGFLGKLGAIGDLKVAYLQAEAQLIRDPLAPVAGWGAIETLFKVQGKVGIRHAFRAGLDIDMIERMSERFILDLSTDDYIDRDAITKGLHFEKKHDDLVRRHENEGFYVGKKRINPFRLYAASSLRTDVARAGMFPGEEPGALLRYSPIHGLVKAEDQLADEYKVLNTYRGFIIKPIGTIDPAMMNKIVTALDIVLGLLTRDNDAQMWWLKKFIAWTIKYPDKKQQVCPVIVGGQGIGKSFFGETLMTALFGDLAGTASASLLSDNDFVITPFIGKLLTFIDEVRLESSGAINEIKKIVRSKRISGQVKFGHQQDYEIYSRLILASNQANIGLTAQDAADRALFFIVAWTAENKGMSDSEFQKWAWGYKPFYTEFVTLLEGANARQHLMRYFCDLECNQSELEDLTHSSRFDENVVRATMSKAREVAREIAASARIVAGNDLTAWFNLHHLRGAISREDGQRSRVEPQAVLKEFELAGVIEMMSGGNYRFKWGYGRTLQEMSKAHNLELLPRWDTGPGDYDANPVMSNANPPPWRGNKAKGGDTRRRPFNPGDDPDAMDPFD
jgi:hypothetical protein